MKSERVTNKSCSECGTQGDAEYNPIYKITFGDKSQTSVFICGDCYYDLFSYIAGEDFEWVHQKENGR